MRTPTACCGSTSPRERIWQSTRKRSSTEWLGSSMNGPARLWASKPLPNDLVPVLHRPLEPATPIADIRGRKAHKKAPPAREWTGGVLPDREKLAPIARDLL